MTGSTVVADEDTLVDEDAVRTGVTEAVVVLVVARVEVAVFEDEDSFCRVSSRGDPGFDWGALVGAD